MEQHLIEGGSAIITGIIKGKAMKECTALRLERIAEAISWKPGPSIDEQRKYVVNNLSNGIEVVLLKPGWETISKKRPNLHDMTPRVGDVYKDATFMDLWAHLSKMSIIDFDAFRRVLVLIYRNAFLLDHRKTGDSIRYSPREDVASVIDALDGRLKPILPAGGLWGFLNFLDILGWNEDVKYHTENNKPTFDGRYEVKVGRPNTLLTCIRVPFQMHRFIKDIVNKTKEPGTIDFQLGYKMMQDFLKTRGTCVPTNINLVDWLAPYIHE